jgi:elongator complex protein 1
MFLFQTTQPPVELIVFLSEDSLAWRPSGNLLAAAVRRPAGNRHVIAFFEKNGLQHGDLELRHQQLTIKQLEWNCDSTVLAVCAQDQERKYRLFILFANLDWT